MSAVILSKSVVTRLQNNSEKTDGSILETGNGRGLASDHDFTWFLV